ncbi:MAG TPA: hypothetical protein VJ983_02750 [candidate division Zixibacteria bacterium]|nr:hypothetical protein [candidate division Zixibacteria bacterium]
MNRSTQLYITISIGIIAAWIFLAFLPNEHRQQQSKMRLTEDEQKLTDFQTTLEQLPLYLGRKKDLDRQKTDLTSKLYTKEDVLNLFDRIREQAAERHLKLTEITPPVEELLYLNTIVPDSSTPQFLNIGLRLGGNYINFGKFVSDLERANYFRGVNRCQIDANADGLKEPTFYFGFKALLGTYKGE